MADNPTPEKSNIVPESHMAEFCMPGAKEKCCRYLMMSPQGFECAKIHADLKQLIDVKVMAGEMVAQADNCDGWGDPNAPKPMQANMPQLDIIPNLKENPWEDIGPRLGTDKIVQDDDVKALAFGCLPGGTVNGKPTVFVRVDLPDGTTVLAQTTLFLFIRAAEIFIAINGDPR